MLRRTLAALLWTASFIRYCFVDAIVIADCEPFSGLCLIGLPLPQLITVRREVALGVRWAFVCNFEVWHGTGWLFGCAPGTEGISILELSVIASAFLLLLSGPDRECGSRDSGGALALAVAFGISARPCAAARGKAWDFCIRDCTLPSP